MPDSNDSADGSFSSYDSYDPPPPRPPKTLLWCGITAVSVSLLGWVVVALMAWWGAEMANAIHGPNATQGGVGEVFGLGLGLTVLSVVLAAAFVTAIVFALIGAISGREKGRVVSIVGGVLTLFLPVGGIGVWLLSFAALSSK